ESGVPEERDEVLERRLRRPQRCGEQGRGGAERRTDQPHHREQHEDAGQDQHEPLDDRGCDPPGPTTTPAHRSSSRVAPIAQALSTVSPPTTANSSTLTADASP